MEERQLTGENRLLSEQTLLMPLRMSQIPHGLPPK